MQFFEQLALIFCVKHFRIVDNIMQYSVFFSLSMEKNFWMNKESNNKDQFYEKIVVLLKYLSIIWPPNDNIAGTFYHQNFQC
jgi:hypothetical protein